MAILAHVGVDYEDAGCVKIMASDIYDPYLTPDTDYGKFLFNSKDVDQFRYCGSDFATRVLTSANATIYSPSGAGASNYTKVIYCIGNNSPYNHVAWTSGFFPTLDYALPLHDMKVYRDGYYVSALISNRTYGYQDAAGEYSLFQASEGGWMKDFYHPTFSYLGISKSDLVGTFAGLSAYGSNWGYRELVVWNLPGDETAIKHPALAPVDGQVQVQITGEFCRASKPGYDVRTAVRTQLAFDSANRPAKVIYAGDIALPAGTTNIDLTPYLNGIAVTGTLIADVMCYQGSTLYFPTNPISTKVQYGASHRFSGTTLQLVNSYSACRARVLVFAEDSSSGTVGDNDVWREFNDGTRDVFQFLRPGAANPPSIADVIVDSRWPTLRVLKEGYIPITASGAREWPVAFDAGGLFPFVKFMTVHGAGSNSQWTGSFSKRIRMPATRLIWFQDPFGGPNSGITTAGDSSYCRLTAGEARFYTFVGNPTKYSYSSSGTSPGYTLNSEGDANPIIGIRYYILGIPA